MRTFLTAMFLLVAGMLTSVVCPAQTTYKFTYDASGNRLTRAVILLKSATIPVDTLQAKQVEKPLDDQIGLQKTRIYPNPTKGLLRIDLPALTEQEATISLHDTNGRLIIQQPAIELNNELNLTVYPSGVYIMIIQIGQNDRKEWKIIKQ
ncbi:MAG: T9SS type A sorting domain-containing protein [Bacteroidota bacterium]|nr:T9SS type A sorting domain-containing protein [Bacteroidota bacterium]